MPDFSSAGLSAPITSVHPADTVLSADGATLYVAGEDGKVRVYDVATRVLQATWDVGIKLGGIDLSQDGSFLVVTEATIIGFRSEGPFGPYFSTLRVYRVDTTTGAATSFSVETQGGDHTFYDAAILANGQVLLSQNAYSAFLPLMKLDLGTGNFVVEGGDYSIRGALTASADDSHVVFTPGNISNGPIIVYESGVGITHSHTSGDGVSGYNNGISAISLEADLIAQQTLAGGVYIYDSALNFELNLSALHPEVFLGNAAGMAFDPTGDHLFILSEEGDRIVQFATADWSVVGSIPVGLDVGLVNQGAFANRLMLIDDGLGFLVTTATGISYVEDNRYDNDFTGSAGNDLLFAGDGADIVSGLGGNDTIGGGIGDDVLSGGAGNDLLDPGTGSDTVNGGLDSDTLFLDWSASATAVHNGAPSSFNAGEGGFDGSFTNDSGLAVAFTSIDRFEITTGAGDDNIVAGNGNDVLNGGGGADTLTGGMGNDIYYVDSTGDVINDPIAAGNDRVVASVSYALAASAEIETLETLSASGTGAIDLTGNGFSNTITGNEGVNRLDGGGGADALIGGGGNDYLIGGAGNDFMAGGTGDDTYYVDDANDIAVESFGAGDDRVAASVSFALAGFSYVERIEALNLSGTEALNFTGSFNANTIYGNQGVNILNGAGDSDILWGFGGDDYLIGGSGSDTLYGGLGNDTFYVDNEGDVVNEAAGEGSDRVAAATSFALSANSEVERIEALNLTSTNAMNLTGSDSANTIYGNDGVNILSGLGGNDTLWGFGGNDFLTGGTGVDAMYGGAGNDTYYVDDSADRAYENAGEGTDRIATSVDYALSNDSEVELLEAVTLAATDAMNLAGSDSANTIIANNGVNILSGAGGNDVLVAVGGDDFLVGGTGNDAMYGGAGNDTYYVDSAGDIVNEASGEGSDRVATSVSYTLAASSEVETLEAVNGADTVAIDLTGNGLNNTITGNAGANVLIGGLGADTLTGLGGADTFAFTTAIGAGNVDRIADFVSGTDKIALDDAWFAGLGLGALPANAFATGTAAADADDRIVYNGATGELFFDADGSGAGAAILFATLQAHPALAASDFIVI